MSTLEASNSDLEHVEDRLGHDFRYCLDIEDTTSKLNWKPSTKLEMGLEKTIAWYKENRNWLKLAQERIVEGNR